MNTVGIIGAMDIEVEALKKDMNPEHIVKKAGMEFCVGELKGQKAVVVKSGIGKVNAAVCTQILIDDFQAWRPVTIQGLQAPCSQDNIGDLVISKDLVHHDMDAVAFGYEPGQVPQMEAFSFEADEKLSKLAGEVCKRVNPEIQVFYGRIVSGDQFVAEKAVKDRIVRTFQGYCTEMEGRRSPRRPT